MTCGQPLVVRVVLFLGSWEVVGNRWGRGAGTCSSSEAQIDQGKQQFAQRLQLHWMDFNCYVISCYFHSVFDPQISITVHHFQISTVLGAYSSSCIFLIILMVVILWWSNLFCFANCFVCDLYKTKYAGVDIILWLYKYCCGNLLLFTSISAKYPHSRNPPQMAKKNRAHHAMKCMKFYVQRKSRSS